MKRIVASILGAAILPAMFLLSIQFRWQLSYDNFPGNLFTTLASPGYLCASLLFPKQAQNESLGLALLPPAMLLNFLVYSLTIYTLTWLAVTLKQRKRPGSQARRRL
jgi:hypothetical protein